MSPLPIVILIGSIQGFIISLVFLFNSKKEPKKVLGVSLTFISLALFLAFLELTIDFNAHHYLIKVSTPFSLIFIPALYIYLQLITGSIKRVSTRETLYFLPALFLVLYNLPFYFGNVVTKIEYYSRVDLNGNLSLYDKLEEIYINVSVLLFSIASLYTVKKYSETVKQVFSDISQAKVHWLRFISISMFVLVSFAAILAIAQLIDASVPLSLNFMTAIGATLIIYYISYYILFHPHIFSEILLEFEVLPESNQKEDISLSRSHFDYKDNAVRIERILTEKQLYRNPEITLSILSKEVGIPAYLVSKIIKIEFETNFHSLINQHRIELVKTELLQRPSTQKSIIEIAYECGFNTKSTFYQSFKKSTGLSPSKYIEINKLDEL